MAFKLLALDGGGIRGYMTAQILAQLEQDAGVSFVDANTVDGYCGTSTGGLLAIGLANKHTPDALATLYRTKADTIFDPSDSKDFVWIVRFLSQFLPGFKRLISGIGILSSQYKADGLRTIAQDLVGSATFGDFDASRVLAVNTAAMKIPDSEEGWTSTTMCNHALPRSRIGDARKIAQIDGALCTSAAPSYFPPHEVSVGGNSLGFFADGGVFANNPVLNGMTVAKAAKLASNDTDFSVISIGTGVQTAGIPKSAFRKPLDFGLLDWFGLESGVPVGALLEITMTTSADNMTWVSGNILGDRLLRLNPELKSPVALDDHSPAAYATMDAAVAALVASPEWAEAVEFAKGWASAPAPTPS